MKIVQFTRPTGEQIAIDAQRIIAFAELKPRSSDVGGGRCMIQLQASDQETKSWAVVETFPVVLKRINVALVSR